MKGCSNLTINTPEQDLAMRRKFQLTDPPTPPLLELIVERDLGRMTEDEFQAACLKYGYKVGGEKL